MNTNNIALRAAMVIALGAVPVVASATIYSPGAPVTLASELPFTGSNPIEFAPSATYGITINMSKFINHTIGTSAPLEIKMSLTNGATFTDTVAGDLVCNYKLPDAAIPAASKLNGANGESTVTFKLPAGAFTAAAAEAVCVFGGGINLTSGSKGGNAAYDMTVSSFLKSVIVDEQVQDSIAGTVVRFGQAYGLSMTPGQVTIDVADPSLAQKFVIQTNVSDAGRSAVLGSLTYKVINSNAVKINNGGVISTIAAGTDLLPTGNLTVTLSGTPLMAAAGGTTVSVGRGAGGALACLPAAVGGVKNPTVSGTVTFDNVTPADLIAAGGTTFCYMVDGATRIDKGFVTFDITAPSDSVKQPNITVTGEKVLTTFYKNGTSIKVLTIPDPTDMNNELNIRIYNMSSSAVNVFGTLYNPKGTVIGEKNTPLGSIDPNAVKVLKSGGPAPKNMEVANMFKVTSFGGGRAWMQIEGDSQQIRVQVYAKTGGVLVNMSDRVIEDGGTFKRPGTK